jgi:hypothetical protein
MKPDDSRIPELGRWLGISIPLRGYMLVIASQLALVGLKAAMVVGR